jgi:hypothetical protein
MFVHFTNCAMTHLTSLPTELLCEIIEHLLPQPANAIIWPPPDPYYYSEEWSERPAAYLQWKFCPRQAQQALYALARTCRILRPLALEALNQNWAAALYRPPIHRLRRLAQRPALFQKITDIAIEDVDPYPYRPDLSRISQLRAEIDSLSLPDNVLDRLYSATRRAPTDTELAVLLLKMPKLSKLRVHKYGEMFPPDNPDTVELPPWLTEILESMPTVPEGSVAGHEFRHLHTLELSMDFGFNIKIAALFYIPSLRKLCIDDLFSSGRRRTDWPVPPSTSNIQSLGLRNLRCLNGCATGMIKSCKALENCEIQLGNGCGVPRPSEQWNELLIALQDHGSTLKQLALKEEQRFITKHQCSLERTLVDGFRPLNALEDLEVPWALIMGKPGAFVKEHSPGFSVHRLAVDWVGHPRMSDMLPPQLRKLTCAIEFWREPQGFYDQALESILPSSSDDESSLETVNCVLFNWDTITPLPIDFAANKAVFDKRGVSFNHAVRNLRESDIKALQGDKYYFQVNDC